MEKLVSRQRKKGMITAAEATELTRRARQHVSDTFIVIRDDVNPKEPHFNFRAFRPEDVE